VLGPAGLVGRARAHGLLLIEVEENVRHETFCASAAGASGRAEGPQWGPARSRRGLPERRPASRAGSVGTMRKETFSRRLSSPIVVVAGELERSPRRSHELKGQCRYRLNERNFFPPPPLRP